MRERIILAPGLNGTELARSLALHGINSIGLRICGTAELARLALMRSGISITEDFAGLKDEYAFVAEAVSKEPYFSASSYTDIREINTVLRRIRCLVSAGDEKQEIEKILPRGPFKDKNDALLHVYREYMQLLTARKLADAVSLIRRAAQESKVIDAEFLTLEEYPLNPLEQSLIDRVSAGNAVKTGLHELFRRDRKTVHVSSYKNCYGAPNEVESILEDIYSGKKLDQCTVAVSETAAYSQLFYDYAQLYDIPVTFGCGIPIINSNPARLASLYYRWSTAGFFGAAALEEMLSSNAFDRAKLYGLFPQQPEGFRWRAFIDMLGGLRLTNDRATNEERIAGFRHAVEEEAELVGCPDSKSGRNTRRKLQCIPYLEIMAGELALPAEEFLSKYAYIRRGSGTASEYLVMILDTAAASAIYDELKAMRNTDLEVEDLIPDLLKLSVCMQRSEPGKVHITGIEGALSSIRENLYIAGLSASKYPGSPKENHLLLDADLKLFGSGAVQYTSDRTILRKRGRLLSLACLASSLGSNISVSFPGLDVSELKKDNPSSLVYELFREEHGEGTGSEELEERIRETGYFEPAVSVSRLAGSAYTKGMKILTKTTETGQDAVSCWDPDRAWSPTELEAFFSCPRRFMLGCLLGIPEPDESDPFEVISAKDAGSLAHSLMEELGMTTMEEETFLKMAGEYFDRFLAGHPPLITGNVQPAREEFLDMMETAYRMDPHREVLLGEEDIRCTHESGVKLHGYPDRVEKTDDGSCLVVDFKSARQLSHEQDDITTCLQVVIYACLMEHNGYKVSGGEYRYIRRGETVSCRYDDDMKKQLSDRLEEFRECLEYGYFPLAEAAEDGQDPCRFCRFGSVCGKDNELPDAEEGGET